MDATRVNESPSPSRFFFFERPLMGASGPIGFFGSDLREKGTSRWEMSEEKNGTLRQASSGPKSEKKKGRLLLARKKSLTSRSGHLDGRGHMDGPERRSCGAACLVNRH